MLKAQMLIWHLFFEAQIFFWQLFHKTQMLLWHIFTKFKYYFDTCFTYTKSLTYGKYKLLISQKISLSQNLWELCLFFHNQLTTKSHEYRLWQNSSFCSDNQAQRSSTTKHNWTNPAHTQNPEAESLCEVTSQISAQTTRALPIRSQLVQSYQKRTHVPQGLNPSSTS